MKVIPLGYRPADIERSHGISRLGIKGGVKFLRPVKGHQIRIIIRTLGVIISQPIRSYEGSVERLPPRAELVGHRGDHLVITILLGTLARAELIPDRGCDRFRSGTAAYFHDVCTEKLVHPR